MKPKAINILGWLTLTIGFAGSFAPKSLPSVTNQFSVENRYGYVRVNSENEEGSCSIKSQKEKLIGQGVAEENILVEVGPDPGSVSASKASKILPKFTKLVEEMLRKVICWWLPVLIVAAIAPKISFNSTRIFSIQG